MYLCVYVHGIDVRLQLRSSLSHRHCTQLYSLRARFSSCCSSAIHIKIYAIFNHELVVHVFLCVCDVFFLVEDYFLMCCYYFIWMDHNKNKTDSKRKTCNFLNECGCNRWISCSATRENGLEAHWVWKDEVTKKQGKKKIIARHERKIDWIQDDAFYLGHVHILAIMACLSLLPPAWRYADDDLDTESLIIAHFVTTYNSNGRLRSPWIPTRLLS